MRLPETLRAGPLTLEFDPTTGWLRSLRLGSREVLRGIYGAIRDRHWGTILPVLDPLNMEFDNVSFHIQFEANCQNEQVGFRWHGAIRGAADGTVTYDFDGRTDRAFARNRIGLCVLHPIRECAGRECVITHTDGSVERTFFPDVISPHQPFEDVRVLRHEIAPGLSAEVEFAGDIFETEDQRNWTDASFKTYCTPLSLPHPADIRPGDVVRQRGTLRLHGTPPMVSIANARIAPLTVGRAMQLPRLGFLVGQPERETGERDSLRALRSDHLRVELNLENESFRSRLRSAVDLARDVGATIHAALFVGEDLRSELDRFCFVCGEDIHLISTWFVFRRDESVTRPHDLELVRERLDPLVPRACIGGGSSAHFTELNRDRAIARVADVLTYAIDPQCHAFDDTSIAETLEAQGETVRSARAFAPGTPICAGPISLKPRRTFESTDAECAVGGDARQSTTFLAGWTLGSVVEMARANTEFATYFEAFGNRGLVGANRSESLAPGETAVFPVFHVFADLAELCEGGFSSLEGFDSFGLHGLAYTIDTRRGVLLTNLASRPTRVRLPFAVARTRLLDDESRLRAMRSPVAFRADWREARMTELELPAHSYLRAEGDSR